MNKMMLLHYFYFTIESQMYLWHWCDIFHKLMNFMSAWVILSLKQKGSKYKDILKTFYSSLQLLHYYNLQFKK